MFYNELGFSKMFKKYSFAKPLLHYKMTRSNRLLVNLSACILSYRFEQ